MNDCACMAEIYCPKAKREILTRSEFHSVDRRSET